MIERKSGSIKRIKTVLMLFMMLMVFEWLPLNGYSAFTQEQGVSSKAKNDSGSMDFNACIKLALEQSPYFKESAMEIDIRRLDESDNLWSFVPSLTLRTTSYLGLENSSGMKVNFYVSEYDPFLSYYSLKASETFTEIAVLAHQKGIEDGIYEMAKKLLELNTLGQIAVCQDEVLAQQLEKVAFYKQGYKAGRLTKVDVQFAEGNLAVARAEREHISAQQSTIMEGLCQFLSLGPSQRLDVDFQKTKQQILGHLEPSAYGLEEARAHSFELKIHELKKELQNYKIAQAYAKLAPKLTVGVHQTTDLDATADDYYYSLSFRMNLWNGFKDKNDISRQKIILNRYKNETRLVELELNTEWQTAKRAVGETAAAKKLACLNEDVARLKEQQTEFNYRSSRQALSALLDSRLARLDARKKSLRKALEHDLKVLSIRHLSGDLFDSFVQVAPWKE